MTVTNRSSVEAADVNGLKVADPRSFRTRLISLRASQGTCRPVHLQPRPSRARRVGDGRRGHRGHAGRRRREHRPRLVGGDRVELPQQRCRRPRTRGRAVPAAVPVADPARRLPHSRGLSARASGAAGVHRPADGVRPTGPAAAPASPSPRPEQGPPRGDAPDATVSRRLAVRPPLEGIVVFVGQRPDGGRRSDAVHHAARRPRGEGDARHRLAVSGRRRWACRAAPAARDGARRSFETRTQPCDTAWPRSSGRSVPWMPTIPSSGQSVSRDRGARLECVRAVERVGGHEGGLDVEVAADGVAGPRACRSPPHRAEAASRPRSA